MSKAIVYDKAKYHYESRNYPKDLTKEQAFVHTGMFLGWILENDLYSREFEDDCGDLVSAFKNGNLTGPQVFAQCDGVLTDDMLNDVGNAFAKAYFDFEHGEFLNDYEELLAADTQTMFHVADTWENYEKLKGRMNERFREWRK